MGCSSDSTAPPPAAGALDVTNVTFGADPDLDGYLVTVNGAVSMPIAANGAVRFDGLAPGEHVVALSGLAAQCLAGQGPLTVVVEGGRTASVSHDVFCELDPRVLVGAGDIATCDLESDEATAALLDTIPGTVFTAGDNVYPNGTAAEFADCYGPTWGRHRDRTRPSPGNHDYNTADASGYYAYFGPRAGEPDKGYYSFEVGSWHVIALNSTLEGDAAAAQQAWLEGELAARSATCSVAYWHHPRFSSGYHGNHASVAPVWDALYEAGLDIVVNGHDHHYERFAPQNPAGEPDPVNGIRQFVVGTGGIDLFPAVFLKANSEARNSGVHGVLKLTLGSGFYGWAFVAAAGHSFTDAGIAPCH